MEGGVRNRIYFEKLYSVFRLIIEVEIKSPAAVAECSRAMKKPMDCFLLSSANGRTDDMEIAWSERILS